MIPHTSKAVTFLAQRLLTHVLPDARTTFGAADAALLSLLVEMVGQDFERAAEARIDDLREMRTIFTTARALGGLDAALAARIDAACAREISDLRIAALDAAHAAHCRALIDLHAWIETLDGADAARLDREIWAHLERHAERHRYDVNF
jgi:hypothetical protein